MKKAHMFYEVLFLKLGLLRGLYSTMSLQNEGNEVFQKAKERDLAKTIKKKILQYRETLFINRDFKILCFLTRSDHSVALSHHFDYPTNHLEACFDPEEPSRV